MNKKWWIGIGLSVMVVGLAACGADTESEAPSQNQIDVGEKVPRVKEPSTSSNDVHTTDKGNEVAEKQASVENKNEAKEADDTVESSEVENETIDEMDAPEGISYKGYGTEDEALYQDVQIAKQYAVKNGLVDGIPNVQYEFNYTEGTYHVIRVFEPKDTYETTVAWLAVEKDSKQVYDITVKPLAKQISSSN